MRFENMTGSSLFDETYLEEFDKEKMLKYTLLLAVPARNRLDPHDTCQSSKNI